MKYSVASVARLGISVVLTKLFFRPARLIRFPIDIRGRTAIRWGQGFTTGRNCRLEAILDASPGEKIVIGKNVQINDNVHLVALKRLEIGDDVLIASKVFISDSSHGSYSGVGSSDPRIAPSQRPLVGKQVTIGNRVWLGDNVVVLPGVTIGEGSVVGASSVVVRDVPANTVVVGTPARVIKTFDFSCGQWIDVRKGQR